MSAFQFMVPSISPMRFFCNRQCGINKHHNSDMDTFANRCKARRHQLGLSQKELATKARMSQTTISDIERGRNDGSRELLSLARALQVNPHWLESGLGDMDNRLTTLIDASGSALTGTLTEAPIAGQRVPLLSAIQAGRWREIVDAYAMGGAEDYALATAPVGSHGFALTVEGDSMTPEFQPGDTLFVNPELLPNPGDFVIARNHRQEATFKRYRPRGLNAQGVEYFELVPLNENHPPMRSDLTAIEIIGVVVEHRRRLR